MLKHPLTFAVPSIINDTDEARAKVERDLKKIVREAVRYFGPSKVKQVVQEITKGRKGNTPDERRNGLMLAEYDSAAAKGPVKKRQFAHDFCKKHRQQSPEAVGKHLARLLKARRQRDKEKAELERKFRKAFRRGKSFLGTE
jgi:hypothetical protein